MKFGFRFRLNGGRVRENTSHYFYPWSIIDSTQSFLACVRKKMSYCTVTAVQVYDLWALYRFYAFFWIMYSTMVWFWVNYNLPYVALLYDQGTPERVACTISINIIHICLALKFLCLRSLISVVHLRRYRPTVCLYFQSLIQSFSPYFICVLPQTAELLYSLPIEMPFFHHQLEMNGASTESTTKKSFLRKSKKRNCRSWLFIGCSGFDYAN